MAEKTNSLVLDVCPTKLSGKHDKHYQRTKCAEITNAIDGLYNSGGGTIILRYNKTPPRKHVENCVRMLEQKIQEFLGTITLTYDVHFMKIQPSTSRAHGEMKITVTTLTKTEHMTPLSYNSYLPSNQQVMEILPSESVGKFRRFVMENTPVKPIESGSHYRNFIKGTSVPLSESKITQFKKVKDKPAGNITFTDRFVHGKSNKFPCYVSAFANYAGGHVYAGIDDDGKVQGEHLDEEEKEKVKEEIPKVIKKMKWPKKSEPADANEDQRWDVHFEPVRDSEDNVIPSLYVVVVFVAQCRGGVFTKEPECYEIVDNHKVQKVDFASWKRMINPRLVEEVKRPCVPPRSIHDAVSECFKIRACSPCHRATLCFDKFYGCNEYTGKFPQHHSHSTDQIKLPGTCCANAVCDLVYEDLTNGLNNNCNGDELNAASKVAQENYKISDVQSQLMVQLTYLSRHVSIHLRKGEYDKAEEILIEYSNTLPKSTDQTRAKVMEQYLYSIMERCKGDYKKSYEIANNCLNDLRQLPVSTISAAFYVQIATLENILAMKTKNRKEMISLLSKAEKTYDIANRHLDQLQRHSTTKAEYQQKIYINKALLHLGCSLSGDMLPDSENRIDIQKAQDYLLLTQQIIIYQGHPLSKFRKIQNLFAQACLSYRMGNNDPSRHTELLKHAVDYSKEAQSLARDFGFAEMMTYAEKFIKFFETKLAVHLNN